MDFYVAHRMTVVIINISFFVFKFNSVRSTLRISRTAISSVGEALLVALLIILSSELCPAAAEDVGRDDIVEANEVVSIPEKLGSWSFNPNSPLIACHDLATL